METSLLLESLPILAKISGGYATLTDKKGRRIATYDSEGNLVKELEGKIYSEAREAYERQQPRAGKSEIFEQASAWFLPLEDYVLAASNIERIQREENLFKALERALSSISQITGGEAVIFNDEGRRLFCVNQEGRVQNEYTGEVSTAALKTMKNQKPVVGASTSVEGAMAVRIPITKKYGIGFNNEGSVQEKQKLLDRINRENAAHYTFDDIVGESPEMKQVKKFASEIAKNDSSVVLFGETGTGKELFAQSIHNASCRRNNPFIAINCGALPPNLVESTLFGYEPGSFTGADKKGKEGLFEKANEGTLFLDEISEMELNLQTKLLRVLQEKQVRRIGGKEIIDVDVRIISSTNKDLEKLVHNGEFREDLFYRLNVVNIKIPPLNERKGDIFVLLEHFIHKFNLIFGKNVVEASLEALNLLENYNWPGNVREFKNCIERIFNVVTDDTILPEHLPPYLNQNKEVRNSTSAVNEEIEINSKTLEETLLQTEQRVIKAALRRNDSQRAQTAKELGISKTTLWRKMKKHNLI